MNINVSFDQSVSSLPAGFVAAVDYVVNYYDTLFTNNVTINIDVGYGEIEGQSLGSNDLGESYAPTYVLESYSSVKDALLAQGAPGASSLPSSSPLSGSLYMSQAEAQALGLTSSVSTSYVGFSSSLPFSYAVGVTPASNYYYFVGVVEHEISEDMGRVSLLNDQPDDYSPIDLFRYSSPGVRDLTTGGSGSTAYFSINNGTTNLGTWNNQLSNGDLADWYPSGPAAGGYDAYNDYSDPGVINVVSANDITLMQALGWTTIEPPTVTANNQTVTAGQQVNLSSIFSVSGSGVTQYQLWFSDPDIGAPADGTVTVNGTPIALDQWVTLSSLSGVVYTGGTTPGTDVMWLQAYDGSWSNQPRATITDPGIGPPTVTANNQTVTAGQQVNLSSIFSVSGSGVTQYQLWFSDPDIGAPADGTVTVSGTPIALDQWVTLSSLSGVVYTGGTTPGTDVMWLQAYDGSWSNQPRATITDPGIGPPTVTANNQTVTAGQQVNLSSIFSVSGSGVTQYQLWFSDPDIGAPADGTVTVSGTPIALDQWVTLSSLSGVVYTGGTTPGTDVMWLQAYDGSWSNQPRATITDPGIGPPTVTANNQTVTAGQQVNLSSIFSVSGSGVTQYQLWFSDPDIGAPADGTVTVNGTPIALDQWVTLSSLSGVVYTGGTTPGTDVMWLQAYDGSWSNQPRATITDPGIGPPTVTANNQTVTAGQQVNLSSIFSVSGSGVTQYQLWFSDPDIGAPADGTVTVNGTPIALDQWVTLSSLSGVVYTGGTTPGTDVMWLQAYDGSWSNQPRATITDPGIGPPTVTANNQTVTAGQQVNLSSIFSVSGSGVTQYQLWFSDPDIGAPADGTVTVNGTPIALDQWVTLSSLSGVVYTGGTTPGTDVMWLQAYDGSWSNQPRATITDPGAGANAGSAVASQTATVGNGATVEIDGASEQPVAFVGSAGTLLLTDSAAFTGTVAGLAGQDTIDLANFQFSNGPTITSVTGSGTAGSTTNVTVNDGSLNVTLALLNQYANQFAVSSTAYSLTADNNAQNHGTQFQLAAPHSS